jgi:hypothetical protein
LVLSTRFVIRLFACAIFTPPSEMLAVEVSARRFAAFLRSSWVTLQQEIPVLQCYSFATQ